jgi:hypothetical protein
VVVDLGVSVGIVGVAAGVVPQPTKVTSASVTINVFFIVKLLPLPELSLEILFFRFHHSISDNNIPCHLC